MSKASYTNIAMSNSAFGALVRDTMRRKGMSQVDLATAAGSSQPYISEIVSGKKSPSQPLVKALALALDADVDKFLLTAGFAPESSRVSSGADPALESYAGMHPPTDEEKRIAAEAAELGISSGSLRMPDFWQWPPEERRRTFRNLENLIEEERRNLERMKKGSG